MNTVDMSTTGTATSAKSGLMSASDKRKLDTISEGAAITGIRGKKETELRTGDVVITAEEVGAPTIEEYNVHKSTNASSTVAGHMIAGDKIKLDKVASTSTNTNYVVQYDSGGYYIERP